MQLPNFRRRRQDSPSPLVSLALPQGVSKLLQRASDELGLLPQLGCQEAVGVGDSSEGSLQGVLQGLGGSGRGGVSVLNTRKLEETLDGGRSNERGTTGGRNKLEGTHVSKAGQQTQQILSKALTLTVTEPHFPLSLIGMEWGRPRLAPQYPRRTGMTLSLAMMMAARMAVATSLEVLIPRPTCPSESPMMTMALNRVR